MSPTTKTLSTCLTGVALMTFGAAMSLQAQDLNARLELRPLTPQEISDYSLGGAQKSAGLNTVGLGQPAYLEVLVDIDVPASENVTVSWSLIATNAPGSTAVLETSPLGTNVPPYKIADRAGGETAAQVVDRMMLRPDAMGRYTVVATVNSVSEGPITLTQEITAGKYLGNSTCGLCHSGAIAPNTWGWTETGHATAFTRKIDGAPDNHFGPNCISCHVVGYDTNSLAVNDGWDDIAAQVGWTFPTNSGANWDAMDPALQDVSNIGCEDCHGPGSQHFLAYYYDRNHMEDYISKNLGAGNCAQCHDSLSHHFKAAEWYNAGHANAPEETSSGCVRCHNAQGFVDFAEGKPLVSEPYEVITCGACHTLHNADNPHQIRTLADVTLMDDSRPGGNTVVTNGGLGKLCMQCHISRRDAVDYVKSYHSHYGPHHGPQTDMLVGANAITYGKDIPSSSHYSAVEDTCVTCHMQPLESGDVGFTEVGGHTFKMEAEVGTNTVEMLNACKGCHGDIQSFDFPRKDYDGNGVIQGVQTEVQGLMDQLGMLLPPYGSPEVEDTSSWTPQEREAAYNYLFVEEDGSHGIHNLSYAVGILKASIADLTDDANNDKLPDSWQIQYFGDINNTNAAPYANPSGDGIPNWLKFYLGVDPLQAGVVLPDGVMFANATSEDNTGGPTRIYTAAEIVFDTTVGVTYQVQAVSELGGTWENIGSPISGTGKAVSFMTPTRHNEKQFFQVVTVPAP